MSKILPYILLSLLSFYFKVQAQRAPVTFKSKIANFGKVKEQTGKIYYDFIFTNKGEDPLRIEKVVPSCGCTAADYTSYAIPKDSSGHVKVTFNPVNRPGEINKTISIYFVGYEEPEILTLKGIVIGTQRLIERELVYPIGNLRFQSSTLNLRTVRTRQPEKREFEFYNAGKKDIEIKSIKYDTSFLKVNLRKAILKPKEISKVILTYNALARKDWGLIPDTLILVTTDDSIPTKSIPIIAHIEEYFPPLDMVSQLNSPKIKFEKTDQHLGATREGNSITHVYKFTNEGKQDLIIRKIVPGCACIEVETPTYNIKPGESSYIKATMNTKYREGVQNKNITVISNSPSTPSIILWMRLNVIAN